MLKLEFPDADGALAIFREPPRKFALMSSNSGFFSVIRILPFRFSSGGMSPHWALLPGNVSLASTLASSFPESGIFNPRPIFTGPVRERFLARLGCCSQAGEGARYSKISAASPSTSPFISKTSCLELRLGICDLTLVNITFLKFALSISTFKVDCFISMVPLTLLKACQTPELFCSKGAGLKLALEKGRCKLSSPTVPAG